MLVDGERNILGRDSRLTNLSGDRRGDGKHSEGQI